MIEIAFDKNDNNEFLNQIRPAICIKDEVLSSFDEYRQMAQQILEQYSKEQIILIRNNSEEISSNLLAVALFVQSCLMETKTECVVFKVKEYEKALNSYKPYVALTIALKYAIRLCNQPINDVYREIENMSYLGINIKRDYIMKLILLTIEGNKDGYNLKTNSLEEAIIAASTFKAISLKGTNKKHLAKILITNKEEIVNIDKAINIITNNFLSDIN